MFVSCSYCLLFAKIRGDFNMSHLDTDSMGACAHTRTHTHTHTHTQTHFHRWYNVLFMPSTFQFLSLLFIRNSVLILSLCLHKFVISKTSLSVFCVIHESLLRICIYSYILGWETCNIYS